jgi:hypothetical protein
MPTPYTLGVFTGGADNGVGEMTAFATLMGEAPTIINAYLDGSQTPMPLTGSCGYGAGIFAGNAPWNTEVSGKRVNIPLIGCPMTTSGYTDAQNLAYLEAVAAGTHDAELAAFVTTWANQGFMTQYWRLGVEMNLTSTPGFTSYSTNPAPWIAAFQRQATVMRAQAKTLGVTLKIIWNPGVCNDTPAGNATKTLWPGASYVDWIGADVYDNCEYCFGPYTQASLEANPTLLVEFYTYPAMSGPSATEMPTTLDTTNGICLSLQGLIDFAKTQGLSICICETGSGSGPADNPYFPAWFRKTLDAGVAEGVPCEFVSIWDNNNGGAYQFTSGQQPNGAKAWAEAFSTSAPGIAGTAPPVVTPPPHAASPANTQVNGTSGTIYDGQGGLWTITSGQQIANNGTVEKTSANVVTLFWTGTALDQLNSGGQWWSQPLSGGGGVSITAPAGYKPPVVPPTVISTAQLPQTEFVIYLAADEYLGNAQCTIAVDGKVVAAGLPVVALKASNQEQGFYWYGSYGAGSHTVTVEFTNDDYGGTAATDRNLYFCSLTVDGTSYGTSTELPSTGDTATIKVTTKY